MSSDKECPVRRGFSLAFWRKKKKLSLTQTKITERVIDCVIELYITLTLKQLSFYNLISYTV